MQVVKEMLLHNLQVPQTKVRERYIFIYLYEYLLKNLFIEELINEKTACSNLLFVNACFELEMFKSIVIY